MANFVSANVKKIDPARAIIHSERLDKVKYLLPNLDKPKTSFRHELAENNNTNKKSIREFFAEREKTIKADYESFEREVSRVWKNKDHPDKTKTITYKQKQKLQKNVKLYSEAIISFSVEQFNIATNNGTDLTQLNKLLEEFCDDLECVHDCKILMNSLHLDEGHVDDNGETILNTHAHLLIEHYDFENHKTSKPINYKNLQTALAGKFEALGFGRGRDYEQLQREENALAREEGREPEDIRPKRLEHREYKIKAKSDAEHKKTMLEVKEFLEPLLPEIHLLEENEPRDIGLRLSEKLAENKNLNVENKTLKEELKQLKEDYSTARAELKASEEATQKDYSNLKTTYEANVKTLTEKYKNLQESIKPIVKIAQEIKSNLKTYTEVSQVIVENNQSQKQTIENLSTELSRLKEAYRQNREDLKKSGEAKQKDYQDLKSEYGKQVAELKASYENQITTLTTENEQLKFDYNWASTSLQSLIQERSALIDNHEKELKFQFEATNNHIEDLKNDLDPLVQLAKDSGIKVQSHPFAAINYKELAYAIVERDKATTQERTAFLQTSVENNYNIYNMIEVKEENHYTKEDFEKIAKTPLSQLKELYNKSLQKIVEIVKFLDILSKTQNKTLQSQSKTSNVETYQPTHKNATEREEMLLERVRECLTKEQNEELDKKGYLVYQNSGFAGENVLYLTDSPEKLKEHYSNLKDITIDIEQKLQEQTKNFGFGR